ncbi:Iron transport multicopper oxidase FET3 [Fusarium oxysporum f. sp. albedinis]|nr:Iron transport multicopper oxidase FET3 [Fusarium oxysporum f. sp. albedinis]
MGGMSIESGRRIMRRGEERKESELRGRRRKFEARGSNAARKRRMQHVRTRGTTVAWWMNKDTKPQKII